MRWLVTGAGGQLGAYLLRALQQAGIPAQVWTGSQTGERFGCTLARVDLTDHPQVRDVFRAARPNVVVHAAALASVAACVRQPELARRVNEVGTALLANLCAEAGARLVSISTDLVFDGERGGYSEEDEPAPLSVYGRSKRAAELAVLAIPNSVVARVSLLFGPSLTGRPAFFDEQVSALREGRTITLFEDEWRTPLSLATAAQALVGLASSDFQGLLHLGGPERMTRLEMGRRLAAFLHVDDSSLVAARREQNPAPEPRPRDTSLDSSRWRQRFPGQVWPSWTEALAQLYAG